MFSMTLAEAELPALSVAVPEMVWFAPSAVTAIGAGQEAIPDKESEQAKVTVTCPLFQPAALAAGDADAVMVGEDLSIFNVTLAEAELPALSVAVPEMVWFSPSAVTVIGAGQEAMPERVSEQVKVTVTGPLFQPLALAAGEAEAVMVGEDLSMLRLALAEAELPALSVAVPETV